MLITREKITALAAVLIALGGLAQSFANYKAPEPVAAPAQEEAARPFRDIEELVPHIAVKDFWKPGAGRNPFEQRENYAEQAPVPLSLPPELPLSPAAPSLRIDRTLDASTFRPYTAPATDPEDGVTENQE